MPYSIGNLQQFQDTLDKMFKVVTDRRDVDGRVRFSGNFATELILLQPHDGRRIAIQLDSYSDAYFFHGLNGSHGLVKRVGPLDRISNYALITYPAGSVTYDARSDAARPQVKYSPNEVSAPVRRLAMAH